MNPTRGETKRSASSRTSSPGQEEGGDTVVECTENDVLLGRGSVGHKGNVQFREIVSGRRDEYLSISKRQQKDWIAHQVMSAVAKKGGRFLKRVDTAEGGAPNEKRAWKLADEASVLHKVKQALREKDSGPVHQRPASEPSPRPSKKTRTDESSPGLDRTQSSARADPWNTEPSFVMRQETSPASEQPRNVDAGVVLQPMYERMQQQAAIRGPLATTTRQQDSFRLGATADQFSSRYPNGPSLSEQARRILAQRGVLFNDRNAGVPQSSSGPSLDALLSLLGQGQSARVPPVAASSVLSSILNNPVQEQALHTARQDSDLAALGAYQTRAQIDSSPGSQSDRLRSLLTALKAANDSSQAVSRDEAFANREQVRLSPRIPQLPDVGDRGGPSEQLSTASIPQFFPEDVQAETKGLIALRNSTKLGLKDQGTAYLSFSLTEMLILAVLCSFGVPSWCPSKLDHGKMFSPIKRSSDSSSTYQISWYDFGLLLQEAAKHWRDRQQQAHLFHGILAQLQSDSLSEVENRAVDVCASYATDCRELAKATLCVLEKLRCFLKSSSDNLPDHSQRSAYESDAGTSSFWMEREIKLWAKTLECHAANGFPISYTVADFLVSFPDHKDNSAFKLVSSCDRGACETIWKQVVALSHARSMTIAVSSFDGLAERLKKSLLNEGAQSWEGMPRWWSLNSFYFDVELLKAVLLDGYVGVLTATLSTPPAAASIRSTEPMTFAQLGVTSKRLIQERFEQLTGLLSETDEEDMFVEELRQHLTRKCLEERIQAFQSLA